MPKHYLTRRKKTSCSGGNGRFHYILLYFIRLVSGWMNICSIKIHWNIIYHEGNQMSFEYCVCVYIVQVLQIAFNLHCLTFNLCAFFFFTLVCLYNSWSFIDKCISLGSLWWKVWSASFEVRPWVFDEYSKFLEPFGCKSNEKPSIS